MRTAFTETIGWVLMVLGLALIALIVILVLNRNVFEAMALSLPAVVVFRGGLGMIRMATASRIARRISEPEELTVARSYPSPQSR